ncbi:MbcA/ParS/Xre antitoxin family protein [Panacagrimonas sp.]|uniref:MbcA/ParS/Xre antitoxin family protein n=1 Tax=Panacagrimonas sp. TaxID=2480088 RepID=UPI003B52FA5A
MEPLIDDVARTPNGSGGRFTEAERKALARQVVKLLELWQLDKAKASEMLGLSANTRTTLSRYAQGAALADQRDLLDRVGNLLGIHKSLRLLFPHNRDLAYRWPTTANRALGGRRPVDVIAEEGLPGLVALRGYLDHLRGQ